MTEPADWLEDAVATHVQQADEDVTCLVLAKATERYVLIYDEQSLPLVPRALRSWAENPELSFTRRDAAAMAEQTNSDLPSF